MEAHLTPITSSSEPVSTTIKLMEFPRVVQIAHQEACHAVDVPVKAAHQDLVCSCTTGMPS